MTQHESRRLQHPVVFRRLQVVEVHDLTPLMRRIVVGGPELEGFHSGAPDDHIKVFFPNPDGEYVTMKLGANGPEYPAGKTPSPMRDYTPRLFDAAAGTLAIDFVLHGDGPASTWAAQAKVGDAFAMGGPRGSFVPADDFDHYVLIGDETALPAIGRWLGEMPAGRKATVLIEVANAAEQQPLPTQADASVTWLFRDGLAPEKSELLENALDDLEIAGDAFWWIACESRRSRMMRKFLEGHRAVPKQWIRSTGYWKHDESVEDED
ncbi:NADPH-dependent ferric siderophore reductase, contains FAD-binding and SIP domains [Pseudoxanthomonas sp. GM95]|uniref:siderophore-interacting protein n=1 Tax=Pseudoxanthomonas sp. GM95 TaxID=1881043 RepID=UPI0008B341CE|nr:siderophore-interacting protein [Pseudoxanthomonas sp. GM95]SEM11809.1 NADPH-dependent ferric siderophore reductase, contains FAD-binding and SIP domains [Pseudoxanthomonas sp. GM95]